MNIDREFLCSNGDLNPNQFSVKLGQDVVIHPNSEIGISKLKFNNDSSRVIDSSNDTFVVLWGQAGMTSDAQVATSSFDFLPPQKYHLKHGRWRMTIPPVAGGFEAGGPLNGAVPREGYGDPNIMTNLIDTLNENNLYDWWGFAGEYTTNNDFSIWAYLRGHTRGALGLTNAMLSGPSIVTDVAPGPGSVGHNDVTNTATGWAVVGTNNMAMPYSTSVIADDGAGNQPPALIHINFDPIPANTVVLRAFGGLILDKQEFYKSSQGYNQDIDWCGGLGDNGEILNYEDIVNQIPISWEVEVGTGRILFKRREILNNGLVGEVVEVIDSGIIYDATIPGNTVIRFDSIIENKATLGGAADNITRMRIDLRVNPAFPAPSPNPPVGTFIIDSSYFFGEKYRIATVWQTENRTNPALPVIGGNGYLVVGVDSARFSDDQGLTLGPISKRDATAGPPIVPALTMGNMNLTLVTSPIDSGSYLPIVPNTTTNYEFQRLTGDCNMTFLENLHSHFYFMNGDVVEAANPMVINSYIYNGSMGLALNVDNLPISTDLCKPGRGISQKRIYTLMAYSTADVAGERERIAEPYNINWKMLHNKSPIVINHLDFRWTDLDGRNVNALEGRCDIILKIRTNPHRMFQQIYLGAVRNKRQVLETYDTTEQNFKLSQSVL
tara:strand:- start:1016 stop:3010 length:1995 start_codon:yes stop_codon:yes gene_type:complete